MSSVNVKCLLVLSRYLSAVVEVVINVFGYMLNVCLCCPLSQPSSQVIINVFGYMLNVCFCCSVISVQ